MKAITKKGARLVGSAGSLADLLRMIQEKMYWTVRDTRPAKNYAVRWGEAFELETTKGWKDDALIVCARGRRGLYFI